MFFPKFQLTIQSESDTENFTSIRNYFDFVDHIFLDFADSKIDQNLFFEIFQKLSNTDQRKKFHLEIYNFVLDDEKVSVIINCLKRWRNSLEHLHLGFKSTLLSSKELNKIINEAVAEMKKLKKIKFNLMNFKLSLNQCRECIAVIKTLPCICHAKLNFKRSDFNVEDSKALKKLIDSEPKFKLMWG